MGLFRVFILGFILVSSTAWAKCDDVTWELKGEVETEITRYNQFLVTLEKAKNPTQEFNTFLNAHGLPIQVSADKISGFPNHLEYRDDELGGPVIVVFLKKLKVPANSGLSFDTVYEYENADSTKKLRQWNIPFNDSVSAIDGNNIVVQTQLPGACGGKSKTVSLSIQPDGTYKVIEFKKPDGAAGASIDKCRGLKIAFKESNYATCRELADPKTKKKRLLIWQIPMT